MRFQLVSSLQITVHKRFSTVDHLMTAGLVTSEEHLLYRNVEADMCRVGGIRGVRGWCMAMTPYPRPNKNKIKINK